MKKLMYICLVVAILASCDKDSLRLTNPNEPGFELLKNETGLKRLGIGTYQTLASGTDYYWWWVLKNHNLMGDVTGSYVGNWNWRHINTPAVITMNSVDTILYPVVGATQPELLRQQNTRQQGYDNSFFREWKTMYRLIQHTNFMLKTIEEATFTGNESVIAVKKKTLMAWAYYWKGFGYSRLGSIYEKGLIVDEYAETNNNYVNNKDLIEEANTNFEMAKSLLSEIAEGDASYTDLMSAMIPNFTQMGRGGVLTPQMWIRNINTYLARNMLVNQYANEISLADLEQIETLADEGINATDKIFTMRSGTSNNLVGSAWSPYRLMTVWELVSERFVQDFRPGDNRLSRNIKLRTNPIIDPAGRGYQYGTRWEMIPIESGGDWASLSAGLAELPMAGCYEENALMLAEVLIRKDEIEEGLAYIDAVRTHQNSGLPALVGTGLNKEQALEELRSERRVALFINGLAFYDARRWGILKPVSEGGGRENAVICYKNGVPELATIDYNYLEWWDVPAQEFEFNPPSTPVNINNIPIR
jgi:starch-binding outer membrane protein, SusD/RagB family